MAWASVDSAESYSNGNNIAGLNGGSGWGGAWTDAGTGTKNILNTPTLEGGLCFHLAGGSTGEPEVLRTFTGVTSGALSFIVRSATTTKDSIFYSFIESGAARFGYSHDAGNNWGLGNALHVAYNSTPSSLGSYSINTNYTIIVDFDCATDQFRISTDGGATFSSWLAFVAAATSITSIRWRMMRTQVGVETNWYFDDIKSYTVPAATAAAVSNPITISGSATSGGSMNL